MHQSQFGCPQSRTAKSYLHLLQLHLATQCQGQSVYGFKLKEHHSPECLKKQKGNIVCILNQKSHPQSSLSLVVSKAGRPQFLQYRCGYRFSLFEILRRLSTEYLSVDLKAPDDLKSISPAAAPSHPHSALATLSSMKCSHLQASAHGVPLFLLECPPSLSISLAPCYFSCISLRSCLIILPFSPWVDKRTLSCH